MNIKKISLQYNFPTIDRYCNGRFQWFYFTASFHYQHFVQNTAVSLSRVTYLKWQVFSNTCNMTLHVFSDTRYHGNTEECLVTRV